MLEMKSTTTSICFKPQKTEYWSSFIFFFSFLNQTGIFLFIFTLMFRSSYVSFVYRLELKSRNTCYITHMVLLRRFRFHFDLSQANNSYSSFIFSDLTIFFPMMVFSRVATCLIWFTTTDLTSGL